MISQLKFKLLLATVCSLVFATTMASCVSRDTITSTSVSPREIYQGYSIFGNKNETNIYAFFRVGGSSGTTVDLQPPSGITINGKQMTKSPADYLKGTSYTFGENGYQPLHEIIYTASDGQVCRNKIRLEAAEFAASDEDEPAVLRRSKTNFVPISRTVFADGEKLDIVLTNDAFQKQADKQSKVYLPASFDHTKKALIIVPETIAKMPNGDAMIVLTISRNDSLAAQTAAGGSLNISYAAKPLAVRIAD